MASVRKFGFFQGCPEIGWPDYYSQERRDIFGSALLSLEEAVAFFYRVKKWQLEINFPGWDIITKTISSPYDSAADETALVCSVKSFFTNIRAEKDEEAENPFGVVLPYKRIYNGSLSWSLGRQAPVVLGNKYAIKFFDISDGIETFERTEYLTFKATATGGVASNYPNAPVPEFPSIGSFTIKPEEFWPYDPNDELGPIYDKTTGAQLRGFPIN